MGENLNCYVTGTLILLNYQRNWIFAGFNCATSLEWRLSGTLTESEKSQRCYTFQYKNTLGVSRRFLESHVSLPRSLQIFLTPPDNAKWKDVRHVLNEESQTIDI